MVSAWSYLSLFYMRLSIIYGTPISFAASRTADGPVPLVPGEIAAWIFNEEESGRRAKS